MQSKCHFNSNRNSSDCTVFHRREIKNMIEQTDLHCSSQMVTTIFSHNRIGNVNSFFFNTPKHLNLAIQNLVNLIQFDGKQFLMT